ncbi:MAG TPA: sulfurtransferase [Miltoncostaeaceae bacterium]|nr:sulfurtransferase [Miltoncostaeaceae bacterium]
MSTRDQVLVSTEWAAAHLDDPAYRFVEVDEDTEAYSHNHLRGAIGWHWRDDLHAAPRREFIDQDGVRALLGRAGVGPDTTVVLYGGNNNWFAAYAYWILRYRGFDRVVLIDGGRKKWELEARELVSEVPSPAPADPGPLAAGRPELRADRDEVVAGIGAAGIALVDVRSQAEYSGEMLAPPHLPQEQPHVPGHVPGAASIPWSSAANDDGTFKSDEELAELYGAKGVTPDKDVIAYCRIGERSSHTWFVLHELLGYERVRNYDGSWTEYGSLVGVPVEVGA